MDSIGGSPGVTQHYASVNVMNDIEYSSFISLVAMNLTPLITAFSQSIGMMIFFPKLYTKLTTTASHIAADKSLQINSIP